LPSTSHWAFPFRVEDGVIATVEQDSAEEIQQNIEAVLNTIVGTRIDAPDFGVPDETFSTQSPNPSVAVYLAAVENAEPRASLLGQATVEGIVRRIVLKETA
jgi:phage baseplate assembly protein W